MTLFDGKPMEIYEKHPPKVIVTASRMTDMPRYYPLDLINEVNRRLSMGAGIHTLVLITKHPASLLSDPLRGFLLYLREQGVQIAPQITITGMGGLMIGRKAGGKPLVIEPNAPPFRQALEVLPHIVELAGGPERVKLRIDPIVRIADHGGRVFSSLGFIPAIIKPAAQLGIKNITFSLLEKNAHKKVDRRFEQMGCTILPPDQMERASLSRWLNKLEDRFGVVISACCVNGFGESGCVDGELLESLHDHNEPADRSLPRKRKACGCTRSLDIGGWPPRKCYTGCDYCYARPCYID